LLKSSLEFIRKLPSRSFREISKNEIETENKRKQEPFKKTDQYKERKRLPPRPDKVSRYFYHLDEFRVDATR